MSSIKTVAAVLAAVLILATGAAAGPPHPRLVPGEILVKFAAGPAARSLDGARGFLQEAVMVRALPRAEEGNPQGLDRIMSVKISEAADVWKIIRELKNDPAVEWAEPRYLRTTGDPAPEPAPPSPDGGDENPNDPMFAQQWALAAIQASPAWNTSHGNTTVKIAIVDSGTDLDHPDLADNIWHNTAELNGTTGVDDDGNGYVDDFYGWDFMDNDGVPQASPDASHGTHTAGSASAATNNGVGIAGVGWSCKIMPVRAGDDDVIYFGIEGIHYAALAGADVISCSWGGSGSSQYEEAVIQDAMDRGSLVVAAAGNQNTSSPHYPAAYEAVLAVASTTQGDFRSSFSNYGLWVDCAAPGSSIQSTINGGGYTSWSGTSMATPHVAGLAGLVVAQHPAWTPAQVEAQILSTCDNIDVLNPTYAGMLGWGRINANRAMTENNPYVVVTGQGYEDGDGDGVIEPGETVDLWVTLSALLAPLAGVQATLSETDPYVTVTQNQAGFGSLPGGGSAGNQANPFTFTVSTSAPGSHLATFTVTITGAGGYSSTDHVQLVILPVYGDHDAGNVVLTVTGFGALGYSDYAGTGQQTGSGFQYPADTQNALYHGSLLVGNAPAMVSDNCYGNAAYTNYDFRTVAGGALSLYAGGQADQEGVAVFNDAGSALPLGVEVTQRSYAWAAAPNDDFVLLRYEVKNTTAAPLNNLHVAIYLDYDVGNYSTNLAGWDADSAVGYVRNSASPYYGLCAVSHPAAAFRAISNAEYVSYGQFTDAVKHQFMTGGFAVTQGTTPQDYSILLSVGPLSLAAGQAQAVGFALLGGDDLADLRANAGAARERWQGLVLAVPPEDPSPPQPAAYALHEAYPNPFNPETVVGYRLPAPGLVNLRVYDTAGREVAALVEGWRNAGNHEVTFDAAGLPSGIYFARLTVGDFTQTQKLVLLK
ncbi:MAG: T9SS C-terminal target domain-containing protein [Candidatus Zixiibacteriota bacterium]|nr:MAG: T9SS C-terminal target domain-containing protein [candidate division Zixibacteria bacterium]